jgi:hypothetical protein
VPAASLALLVANKKKPDSLCADYGPESAIRAGVRVLPKGGEQIFNSSAI